MLGTVCTTRPTLSAAEHHEQHGRRRRGVEPQEGRVDQDRQRDAAPEDQRLAADDVRQLADEGRERERDQAGDGGADQRHRRRQAELAHGVGRHVESHHIRGRGAADQREDGGQHGLAVLRADDRQAALAARRGGVFGGDVQRFLQVAANVHAHRRDQHAQDERHAPAPALHGLGGQRDGQHADHHGTHQHAQALAGELPAGHVAAVGRRGVLHQQRGRGAHFAAGRKALDQPRQHDDDRRRDADARVGGRERDQRAAQGHQEDGERHGLLAARAVGVRADDDAAQRPHDEADAEAGHRQQQLAVRIEGRKEQFADHQGQEAVDREVEELQPVANGGGHDGLAPARGRRGLLLAWDAHVSPVCLCFWRMSVEGIYTLTAPDARDSPLS
jgi:hypothetical protein